MSKFWHCMILFVEYSRESQDLCGETGQNPHFKVGNRHLPLILGNFYAYQTYLIVPTKKKNIYISGFHSICAMYQLYLMISGLLGIFIYFVVEVQLIFFPWLVHHIKSQMP